MGFLKVRKILVSAINNYNIITWHTHYIYSRNGNSLFIYSIFKVKFRSTLINWITFTSIYMPLFFYSFYKVLSNPKNSLRGILEFRNFSC